MKTIPLTRGKVALIDDADFELVSKHSWRAIRKAREGCENIRWYASTRIDGKTVYMHRLLLGSTKEDFGDHRDGDGLNNQRDNLRRASRLENNRNQTRKRRGCTSRFKGVYWDPRVKRWAAQIRDVMRPGKRTGGRHLGRFLVEEDAARAYNRAAVISFGDFAFLNKVSDAI